MSSEDTVIKVSGLGKCYEIYDRPKDRLKQFLFPWLLRKLGQSPKQYFREFWAMKDVSFEITRGETVGIIGRNGGGKSTLLQMICGTLYPTSGSIQTRGRIAALLELGSGFNPEFTGRENVYMNASVLGLNAEEIDARFSDIVAFADIGQFIDQPVKTYSSGMMVRLAFAVIAHVNADILVVDEALAVGDAFFTQKCMRFLRKFMETGTVLFVSHDTAAVVNLCSRAILLDGGRIVAQGHPKDVSEKYLAKVYERTQEIAGAHANSAGNIDASVVRKEDYRDMRESFINNSNLRNDIEIFRFNPDENSGFGLGDAQVALVRLLDSNNDPLSWIVGGEDVILEVVCTAHEDLSHPIVGFQFKDRLGQVIFADNTYVVYRLDNLQVRKDQTIVACFSFRMPLLPSGDYSVTVAIAEGAYDEHVQHHWVHDALVLKVHASPLSSGLVGIPMRDIRLQIEPQAPGA